MPDLDFTVEGRTAIVTVHGVLAKHPEPWECRYYGLVDVVMIGTILDAVTAEPGVQRIVLDFRSPGGEVTGIPELGNQIAAITSKETVAFTDSQCCSGALWLASQARSFYATESSQIGSVGVYYVMVEYTKRIEEMGMKFNAISAGKFKLAGAYFKEMTDAERKLFQD